MRKARNDSALVHILKAFIPYSRESFVLGFSPNRFFNELEKSSGYSRKTLEQSMRRARQQGLIEELDNKLRLTVLGQRMARPYSAGKLKNGKLMIVFDVPENQATARRQLRLLLRKWGFKQSQKSVWVSDYDHRESVKEAIKELRLQGYVKLYECALLYPLDK